jgi:hypothetical protein
VRRLKRKELCHVASKWEWSLWIWHLNTGIERRSDLYSLAELHLYPIQENYGNKFIILTEENQKCVMRTVGKTNTRCA